ncbi:MAG: glycosyltransferase, partial [Ignavibacteriaceae bacterium]|nr:glycosyltransferase [Ignavibacteriaceae bacterium]
MNSTKHIVIITPGFPDDENDFLTIPPLQEFLKSLKSSFPFLTITVIALQYPYHHKKYKWHGLQIVSMAGKNKPIKKPLLWFKTISEVKKINKSNKIDVIHSLWLGECAMIGNILSTKFNCKHICTLMGQDVKRSNKYLRLLNKKKITIVAISKNQSAQFFKLTNQNADEIISWGIDDIPVTNCERDIDLLAVGSLIPLKNYSLLINLVEKTATMNPEVKCKLVGTGPEELNLKQLSEEKGLEKNINFTGVLNHSEIFKLMQRSKIFVHPSKFEGFGYVFAEALANGMNIVSFNVGYAQPHPKWFIAVDEKNFLKITLNLLVSKLDFSPV